MTEKELVLEGEDAKRFVRSLSKELTKEEKREIEEAEKFYTKHCKL
ncbi:MAG: hypothetical protein ACRD38_12295 [Nitrososphaerales archaeon]